MGMGDGRVQDVTKPKEQEAIADTDNKNKNDASEGGRHCRKPLLFCGHPAGPCTLAEVDTLLGHAL